MITTRQKQEITISNILTPLGIMLGGATNDGICRLQFIDRFDSNLLALNVNSQDNLNAAAGSSNIHLAKLHTQLNEYFNGIRKEFTLSLVLSGTTFQKNTWKVLQSISYGTTFSYQEQAENVGTPKAVRATANANGSNRIAIIVPCHRVIGKNGKLTGYSGGLWRKQYLLDFERKIMHLNKT